MQIIDNTNRGKLYIEMKLIKEEIIKTDDLNALRVRFLTHLISFLKCLRESGE